MFIFGRFIAVRRFLWSRPGTAAGTNTESRIFPDVDVNAVTQGLRLDGMSTGLQLPHSLRDSILLFAESTPCFGSLDRTTELAPEDCSFVASRSGRPILIGHYFDRIEHCEAIIKLRNDPALSRIASNYLGEKARVISNRLWWSFPSRGVGDSDLSLASQEKLHFDLDDWRALKFFFYLTPVDHDTGPHVYIKKTHNRRIIRHQLTFLVGHPNDQVLAAYGAANKTTILGEAGFGFAVDPFGFHMGTAVKTRPRLMLEIGFGVSTMLGGRFYGETAMPSRQKVAAE